MEQNKRTGKRPQPDLEQGNEMDPRVKESYGPGGDRAGIDGPGVPTKKNPGQTNPAHNTPSHMRQDQPNQQDLGQSGQGQTQSYPGIKGPKTHDLQQDSTMDEEQAKASEEAVDTVRRKEGNAKHDAQEAEGKKATQFDGNPNPQGAPSSTFGPKDDTPMKLEKTDGPRDDQ
ncbi:hypothetical protein EKL30_14670 [Candidimonas sp. SYP-B2681]|uniref:hypothetical protein n=1 Tax=Candidimonas sp. SYP-B2681 TaxID=2497686 RepID=UPI000F88BE8B|nr:hypothetical protein [Candidimonas sp. SYP-B2681]RTZ40937.1 hypothetical protein EKL30_14670 [Candidimonas sp. SYP-B2681]